MSNSNNHACKEYTDAFVASCRLGHLEIAQFLLLSAKSSIDPATFEKAYVAACEYGHLHVLQQLHISAGVLEKWASFLAETAAAATEATDAADKTKYTMDWNHLYVVACKNKRISVSEWIVSIHPNVVPSTLNALFYIACENGNLEAASHLWNAWKAHGRVQMKEQTIECAFEAACFNGHAEVAKWLYSIENKLQSVTHHLFHKACNNGDVKTAKLIASFGYNSVGAFYYACQNGHLEVAKFLVEGCGITSNLFETNTLSSYFIEVCKNGHADVAKWLLSTFPAPIIDISYTMFDATAVYTAFGIACKNGHLEIVQWFHEMDPVKYAYTVTQNTITVNIITPCPAVQNK